MKVSYLDLIKTLYIIRGVSGSGKSTLAKLLASEYNIAADDFPGLYVDGVYNLELQKAAHEWCFETVKKWLQEGHHSIAVHNTFCKVDLFKPYEEAAIAHGYRVQVIHAEGNHGNTHNVPQSALDRQINLWENYWDGLKPTIKPLKHYVIKNAIQYAIHGTYQDKLPLYAVDLSGVPKTKNLLIPENYDFLFDKFIVDLAIDLGVRPAQLPKIWIEGSWVYLQVQEPGDAQ
jgi:hypothetical protein